MRQSVSGLVILLLALGCQQPQSDLKPFIAEKTAADFPGVSYPTRSDLPGPETIKGPVWVVGVDGATWDVMEPLLQNDELPNFAALMLDGAHGTLLAEEPTISPALWATIATGVPRFEHGIVNFVVKLPGEPESTTTGPLDRRAPAIWEMVDSAGGEAAVISWFGSFPAEPINGTYVSKDFDFENPKPGQVHPEEFAKILKERAQVTWRETDYEAIARTDFMQETLLDDARTMAALRLVAAETNPDLIATYFAGIDVAQHVHWRDMDPTTPSFPGDAGRDEALADVIPSYYRYVDHLLGEIIDMLPQDATLIVLSDHGGGPMGLQSAFRLRLQVLLEQIGLLAGGEGTVLAIDEQYRHDKRIWLNLEQVEAHGSVPLHSATETAADVARRLAALETDQGGPVFESIRNHVIEPEWIPGDPALTVRFAPEVLLAASVIDGDTSHEFAEVRLRRSDVSGTHRPEGILLVRGPEVAPGRLPLPANQYQIAPLVLYLLGLPQDGRMLAVAPADGGVNEHLIAQGVLQQRPIETIAAYPHTSRIDKVRSARHHPNNELTNPIEEEALEKLRSLGYVN